MSSQEEQIQQRRANLDELAKLGVEVYPHRFERRHTVSQLVERYGARTRDELEGEHGYIKTFIYELKNMGPSAPNWLEKVREFRALVSKHAHMEEERVFPSFKDNMTEEQNAKITSLVNADGFWMA